ncbi:hypothetical protein DFH08DRAFT_1082491 [Mycena albidolilacea]|uniref:Uncharacterized protein n=1 Tax=Mycena albidolilacea TaxID=1033008 RepID=A0AAD6ZUH4_9AGAR|nr:hypothetical protein DFH08DRAFT_1082491 [Mycena albidolilacea]
MFAKFISIALIFFVLTQGTVAIACGSPGVDVSLPACPSYPPCPPCTSDEYCCYTLGSRCIPTGSACPIIGVSNQEVDGPSS